MLCRVVHPGMAKYIHGAILEINKPTYIIIRIRALKLTTAQNCVMDVRNYFLKEDGLQGFSLLLHGLIYTLFLTSIK